ncbi:hypothetical protein V8F06_000114 [Rhypophila decipiens]
MYHQFSRLFCGSFKVTHLVFLWTIDGLSLPWKTFCFIVFSGVLVISFSSFSQLGFSVSV